MPHLRKACLVTLILLFTIIQAEKDDSLRSTRKTRKSGQDPLIELMLRALALPNVGTQPARSRFGSDRMDPLLRQLMITALERSQDERDRDNLSPPRQRQDPLLRQLRLSLTTSQDQLDRDNLTPPDYRQDPLLRKLMNNIVDSFADMVLELPRRNQDHLLQILRSDGVVDKEIENLLPPSAAQNPFLRQLMSGLNDDFLGALNPPSSRQNPLLRQLAQNAQDDKNAPLVPPSNPFLRQLSSQSEPNLNSVNTPIFRQDVTAGNQGNMQNMPNNLNFQSLMTALTRAAGNMNSQESALPAFSPLNNVGGGIDFSTATMNEDGALCVTREDIIETVVNDPVLECSHEEEEKCHLTYVTFFKPGQQEVCEDNFEKSCHITFRKEASKETIRKCNKPLEKICNGEGLRECRMEFETSCTTRRVELSPGKYIGDTKCTKIPLEICGEGCVTQEGAEECHEEGIDSLVDVPEEYCDIIPHKSCRHVTKLIPSLKPTQECTIVPKEICNMNFSQKKITQKPLKTEWCLDRSMALAGGARGLGTEVV